MYLSACRPRETGVAPAGFRMSKAFTKDDEGTPEAPPEQAPPAEPRPITPEGLRTLQQELAAAAAGSRRARQLQALLPHLVPQPAAPCAGRAVFGCWVVIEDEDGRRATWRLVGPDEADARARKLSVASPLARALLGRAPGDEVTVELPRGPAEFTLREVCDTPPEDEK